MGVARCRSARRREFAASAITSTDAMASDATIHVDPHSNANCVIAFVSSSMNPAPSRKHLPRPSAGSCAACPAARAPPTRPESARARRRNGVGICRSRRYRNGQSSDAGSIDGIALEPVRRARRVRLAERHRRDRARPDSAVSCDSPRTREHHAEIRHALRGRARAAPGRTRSPPCSRADRPASARENSCR